jgi:hypothetical protein
MDAILMKRLTFEGIRIRKKVAIIFNNDGKAAFDRMVPSAGGTNTVFSHWKK